MKINDILSESNEPPEGSLAAQLMATARGLGMKPRLRGTPDEERERTRQMLAQRHKDNIRANKVSPERIKELEDELEKLEKEYQDLGGSNWQYADREQNLTDVERRARAMEPTLNNLRRQINAHKEANDTELDEDSQEMMSPADSQPQGNYGMPGFGDAEQEQQVQETIVKKGSKWEVQSQSGENLGRSDTKAGAVKRLGQVEWFKKHK